MTGRPRSSPPTAPRLVGVIDIGTNSVKLAVGYVAKGRVVYTYVQREPTRLGRGLAASGKLDVNVLRYTVRAVMRLVIDAQRNGASDMIAVGTYAFRAASNGEGAARGIARVSGVPVKILTGAEEATMVLRSVQARLRTKRDLMVLDIGGGSAELIVTRGQRTPLVRSVPLGAVRLTEKFLANDPVTTDEYLRLNEEIERVVAGMLKNVRVRDLQLVVSGGTATTAASMLELRSDGGGSTVSVSQLRALELRCLRSTTAQRKNFHGLPPDRADIITAGLAVLLTVASYTGKRSIRLIEGGVRDGVMLSVAEKASRSRRRNTTTARPKAAARKAR